MTNTTLSLSKTKTTISEGFLYPYWFNNNYEGFKRDTIVSKAKSFEKFWAKIIPNMRYYFRDQPFYLLLGVRKLVVTTRNAILQRWHRLVRRRISNKKSYTNLGPSRKRSNSSNYKKKALFIRIPNTNYCDEHETKKLKEYFIFFEEIVKEEAVQNKKKNSDLNNHT